MTSAGDYNRKQLDAGKLTVDHVSKLVEFWQTGHGLDDDAKAGPNTIASIDHALGVVPGLPVARCWPLRKLADGRLPTITSGFRNPERKNHSGADIMFRYQPGDPPMKVGDSGRERNWWVPEDTHAVAVADGKVEIAGKTSTGWRVWIRHTGGYASGCFHLTQLFVQPGDNVTMGEALGVVGDNPIDTDPDHLHFELVIGDLDNRVANLRDPMLLLKGAEILG